MAYRSFGVEPFAVPIPARSRVGSGETARSASFTALERQVIVLAEADPVASIGAPKRFTRFFERWFGFKRPSPLANERLEALRRFAVLARVPGGQLPAEEVKRFLAANFSLPQARALQRRAAGPAL
jgi:hypothetical protein